MKKNRLKKYFSNRNFTLGFIMVSILFLLMVVGFFYLPADPNKIDVLKELLPPSCENLLGTDQLGRDILSRVMVGSRISFFIGFCVVLCGGLLGCTLGGAAGYYGGKIDSIITKIIDTQMAFPGVLLALMLIAVFGNSVQNLILALSVMSVPRFARMSRSGFLKYRNSEFVKAAKVKGASDLRIMILHIFPNLLQELSVTATLSFSGAIMSEAGLSYLSLGIQPPTPSFGKMLSEAQNTILTAGWYVVIPAALITMLVLGFNLISDGLNEIYRH